MLVMFPLLFIFRYFGYFILFVFPYEFQNLSVSTERKPAWDFDWDYVEYIDQIVENLT